MLLSERVKLEPSFLHNQFRDEIVRRLKLKVEGLCSRHGYIKPNSIEVHKICTGRVELVGLNGNTDFTVIFYADVCNPMLGSIIKCRVTNINKFGVLVEAENVIEAIIAKNSVNIQSDVDLDKVRIGDDILIEVVGKKYELNEKKISLIGKAIKDTKFNNLSIDTKSSKKTVVIDEIDGDIDGDEIDDDDVDARSLEGGHNSSDSEVEDSEVEDSDVEEEEEVEDADDVEDDAEIFSEHGDTDDDKSKHNGNFFSDDEEPYQSDGGSSFDDDVDDDQLLSDDE
jgi:DNA-directed RNA polymerase subunit E'/Rpb7